MRTAFLFMMIMVIGACVPKKEFNGGTSRVAPAAIPAINNCTTGITDLTSLSQRLDSQAKPRGGADKQIRFSVSLRDCNGKAVDLSGLPILFDIDTQTSGVREVIPFKVFSADTQQMIYENQLVNVAGSDLFGVVSPQRSHWRGNFSQLSVVQERLVVEFDLSALAAYPIDSTPETLPMLRGQEVRFDTYFRIDNATPAKAPLILFNL